MICLIDYLESTLDLIHYIQVILPVGVMMLQLSWDFISSFFFPLLSLDTPPPLHFLTHWSMSPCLCTPVPYHLPPTSSWLPTTWLLPRTPKPASFLLFSGCPTVFWSAAYYLLRLTGTSAPVQIPPSWSTLYVTYPTAEYATSSPLPLHPFPPCHPPFIQGMWSPASWTSTSSDTFFLFFFPPFQDLS